VSCFTHAADLIRCCGRIRSVPLYVTILRFVADFDFEGTRDILVAGFELRPSARPRSVAHVVVAKYADHCPLYRQAQILARQRIAIDRATLAF